MAHLTIDEILAYIAGKTKEEDSFKHDVHLAECRECIKKVHSYYTFRDNFDEVWDSWTAENHAEEVLRSYILKSLTGVKVAPKLKTRILTWAQDISQKTEAALDIAVDSSRKKVKVFQKGLEGLCRPGEKFLFSLIPPPVRTLGEGEVGTVSVEMRVPSWVKVDINPSARRIAVQGQYRKDPLPLVVLIAKGRGGILIEEFRRPEEADFILAEFDDIPDGEYFLLLESVAYE